MKKTPNNIKKTLLDVRQELLKDKKLRQSQELYTQKLNEIFTDQVIELNESIDIKMSSTGTGKPIIDTNMSVTTSNKPQPVTNTSSSKKIILLNNEIINNQINTNEVQEANNDLLYHQGENIIELKDEVKNEENIIELKDEITNENELALADDSKSKNIINQNNTSQKTDVVNKVKSLQNEQLEILNEKINDLDLNGSEMSDKIDNLLDQKNLFSEKFNDELDIKLTEALNRTEDNLDSKLNNINNLYHEELSKYEDEANKNFAHLENQINELSLKIDNSIEKFTNDNQNQDLEVRLDNRINEVINNDIKIEDSLTNIDQKIDNTLEKFESVKIDTENKIQDISEALKNIEPELIKKIEEKQKNKTESERLQEKFDQMSKIMDTQNMRLLQMYHSSELQNSHSILQKNLDKNTSNTNNNIDPKILSEELKKDFFSQIKKEMDQQFNLLKEQLSEYEIKSVLDKIKSTDLNKEFKKPTKKFLSLFEAKKYVKNSIAKKSRDWLKDNELAIEEIAKKLLDK